MAGRSWMTVLELGLALDLFFGGHLERAHLDIGGGKFTPANHLLLLSSPSVVKVKQSGAR